MMKKAILCLAFIALATSACGRSAPDTSAEATSTTGGSSTTATTAAPSTQPTTTVERFTGSEATYIVASGDAFSLIAAKFNVSAEKLAEFNDITDTNLIRVGQTIYLPPGTEEVVVTTAPTTTEAPAEDTSTTFATATTAGS